MISACGLAYLDDGEVVQLSQPDEALLVSDDVTLYPDCDAMVVRDPESGKYGLYVHGQRQYDFLYDAIAPAESDLQWRTDAYQGTGGTAALRYVSGAAYPSRFSLFSAGKGRGGTVCGPVHRIRLPGGAELKYGGTHS